MQHGTHHINVYMVHNIAMAMRETRGDKGNIQRVCRMARWKSCAGDQYRAQITHTHSMYSSEIYSGLKALLVPMVYLFGFGGVIWGMFLMAAVSDPRIIAGLFNLGTPQSI